MGYPRNKYLDGRVRIVNRLRRALIGSDSAFGVSLDRNYPREIWAKIAQWPFNDKVHLEATLGQILQFASRAKIMQAKSSRKGTQLKLHLILDGGQMAFFKPKWYSKNIQLKGEVYGGKDRHFGEIAAFHLSQVLGYNNAPITVGRKLDLSKDILPVATNQLKNTFSYNEKNNHCFYGVCYFCSPKDPVCANGEALEGALVLLMNQDFKSIRNPWQRNYKSKAFSNWQLNNSFCKNVTVTNIASNEQEEFLLDIIAVSIFDFLIGNGDRHTFDVLNCSQQLPGHGHSKCILLIDNGKSFGNPYEDYLDILAPLYQCCKLRKELWKTIKQFQNESLGDAVDFLLQTDPLYPLLAPEHLTALNHRLRIVISVVEDCIDRHSIETVIL